MAINISPQHKPFVRRRQALLISALNYTLVSSKPIYKYCQTTRRYVSFKTTAKHLSAKWCNLTFTKQAGNYTSGGERKYKRANRFGYFGSISSFRNTQPTKRTSSSLDVHNAEHSYMFQSTGVRQRTSIKQYCTKYYLILVTRRWSLVDWKHVRLLCHNKHLRKNTALCWLCVTNRFSTIHGKNTKRSSSPHNINFGRTVSVLPHLPIILTFR